METALQWGARDGHKGWLSLNERLREELGRQGIKGPGHLQKRLREDKIPASLEPYVQELRKAAHGEDNRVEGPLQRARHIMMRRGSALEAPRIEDHLGRSWMGKNKDGAPPRVNIEMLKEASKKGADPERICRDVLMARMTAATRVSTNNTYAEHLKAVEAFCTLLDRKAIPAEKDTIQLYTTVLNNAATLRGHLAAWRKAHQQSGFEWPASGDEVIRAVHAGTMALQPEREEKPRMRKMMLKRVLAWAVKKKHWEFGTTLCMMYAFLLRGPSEWWAQAEWRRIDTTTTGEVRYGPIQRKHRKEKVTLNRTCCCQKEKLMCPHQWLEMWRGQRPGGRVLTESVASWTAKLRGALTELGVQEEDAMKWSTHVCRRGAAADILHRKDAFGKGGLRDMLQMGDWSGEKAANPYTPRDEVEAVTMGEIMLADMD